MSNLAEIISKLKGSKPFLVEKYGISKIGVFGSYAREEHNSESDVDILVEFSNPIGLKFVTLANELESILNEKVDLVSSRGVKPSYKKIVEQDLKYV
jgi:hypothetical protein